MTSTLGAFLAPDGYAGPRGVRALARETSVLGEAVRLVGRSQRDRAVRLVSASARERARAADAPVLLIPGFLAGDVTLRALGTTLRRHGYRTYRAHIHANVDCARASGDRLEQRLEEIAERRDRRVSIVGHSLGGMLARGLASRRPDLIESIVTLGSPVLAPAAVHRVLVWDLALLTRLQAVGLGGVMAADCVAGECAREAFEETHLALPVGVAYTAIYSRRDGIVDWRACLDPAARTVEVFSSHCGMAFDPAVHDHVVAALDQVCRSRRSAARARRPRIRPEDAASVGG